MEGNMYKERMAAWLKIIQAKKFVQEDNVPCKIDEGLYLGSVGAATNCFALKRLNITHILTVASSLSPAHPNDFTYKTISVVDSKDVNLWQYFNECFAFIEEARVGGGGVLVHCFAGRSRRTTRDANHMTLRSAGLILLVTVVVAYLMFKKGMTLSEAMDHVRKERPVISPNIGFMLQLHDYEATLRGGSRPEELKEHEQSKSPWEAR